MMLQLGVRGNNGSGASPRLNPQNIQYLHQTTGAVIQLPADQQQHPNPKALVVLLEALEAALNEERMAQAVEMFERLDKNKDGKITDKEVPPAQFQKPVWIRANVNGDMILSWEEELIWQYNTQKKNAGKSK